MTNKTKMKSVLINGSRIKVELPKGMKKAALPSRLNCSSKKVDKKLAKLAKDIISFK